MADATDMQITGAALMTPALRETLHWAAGTLLAVALGLGGMALIGPFFAESQPLSAGPVLAVQGG